MQLQGNNLSSSYIQEMVLYWGHLLFNVTPKTMAIQHQTLLKYVSSENYGEIEIKLLKDEQNYKKEAITTLFHPTHVSINQDNQTAILTGDLKVFTAAKEVSHQQKTFQIKYTVQGGKIFLLSSQETNTTAEEQP